MLPFARSVMLGVTLLAVVSLASAAHPHSIRFAKEAGHLDGASPVTRSESSTTDGAKKAATPHEEPAEGRPVRPGDER